MDYCGGQDYGWGSGDAAPQPEPQTYQAPPPEPRPEPRSQTFSEPPPQFTPPPPPPPPMASLPDPTVMSVRELKAELMNLGVDFSDCYEKSELVAKLCAVQEKQRNVLQIDARTTAPASAAVIFLHGLGDQAHGWLGPLQTVAQRLPHVRFLIPNAPVLSIALNGGAPMPAWFDVAALDASAPEDRETIGISFQFLSELIRDEIQRGIRPERIVIGGFAQGAAVALNAFAKHSSRLGGCFSLSGWLPLPAEITACAASPNHDAPIAMFHGSADPVVAHAWGESSKAALGSVFPNISFKSYEGMGHQSNAMEMADVSEFLLRAIP